MLTVAHTLTTATTRTAIEAGIDGLVHVFMDRPHTAEIINLIKGSGAFVAPCIVLNASMMGISAQSFSHDPRVSSKLTPAWLATLRGHYGKYPQGSLEDVLTTVKALHDAGVDILAGTDVSVPVPFLGGMAHGASVTIADSSTSGASGAAVPTSRTAEQAHGCSRTASHHDDTSIGCSPCQGAAGRPATISCQTSSAEVPGGGISTSGAGVPCAVMP